MYHWWPKHSQMRPEDYSTERVEAEREELYRLYREIDTERLALWWWRGAPVVRQTASLGTRVEGGFENFVLSHSVFAFDPARFLLSGQLFGPGPLVLLSEEVNQAFFWSWFHGNKVRLFQDGDGTCAYEVIASRSY